jgi:hypothetical protein
MLPNFSQNYNALYVYPWEHKTHAALLRASLQVGVPFLKGSALWCAPPCDAGTSLQEVAGPRLRCGVWRQA